MHNCPPTCALDEARREPVVAAGALQDRCKRRERCRPPPARLGEPSRSATAADHQARRQHLQDAGLLEPLPELAGPRVAAGLAGCGHDRQAARRGRALWTAAPLHPAAAGGGAAAAVEMKRGRHPASCGMWRSGSAAGRREKRRCEGPESDAVTAARSLQMRPFVARLSNRAVDAANSCSSVAGPKRTASIRCEIGRDGAHTTSWFLTGRVLLGRRRSTC